MSATSLIGSAAQAQSTNTANGDVRGGNSSPSAQSNIPAQSQGQVRNAGDQSQKTQMMAAGVNGAAAVGFGVVCKTGDPSNKAWACPMAAMTAVQAGMSLLLSMGSKSSSDAATASLPTINPGAPGAGAGPNQQAPVTYDIQDPSSLRFNANAVRELTGGMIGPKQLADIQEAGRSAAAAGVRLSKDGKTVTLPGGKKVPTSSFASPDGMRAAGFSQSQIDEIQKTMAKAGEAAKKAMANMTLDESGGGGYGGAGAGSRKNAGSGGGGGFNFRMPGDKKDLGPRAAAGMTRRLDRDVIGVAGDDIFQMVSRQYQKRDKQDEFIK